MYKVNINPYEISKNNIERKAIKIDNEEIYLSVGAHLSMGDLPYSLLIDVHYSNDKTERLTDSIKDLKSFGTYIAINPKFKDKKLISKLKELSIISDTINKVTRNNKIYEIVEVNIDVLKEYKPFGDSILKDFKKEKDDLVL